LGLCLLAFAQLAMAGPTYYVDATNGDDARTDVQAQNPATPWRTIKQAMDIGGPATLVKGRYPSSGYTVIVNPGFYPESVESKYDGLANDPVVVKAASPGSVTIQPPAGSNGFFISHHYHVVDGFIVTGATVGLKMGPHDHGDGPVEGLVVRYNQVHHNSNNGIQFSNGINGVAEFNRVYQNSQNGLCAMERWAMSSRGTPPAELVRAVWEVAQGYRYLSPPLSERAIELYLQRAEVTIPAPYDSLTAREREVLGLISERQTSSQIAARLCISPRTVETHRTNLLRKLGLSSQTELVRFAVQHGLGPQVA
jgi:DNA-binding CsgD family transcriptional regulator